MSINCKTLQHRKVWFREELSSESDWLRLPPDWLKLPNLRKHRRRQRHLQSTPPPAMASKILPYAFRHTNRSIRRLPLHQCRAFTASPQILIESLFVVRPQTWPQHTPPYMTS